MSKARVGEACYGKSVPGAFGSVVLGRVRDDVKMELGKVIEQALRQSLIKHLGIDLASPDDEVRDGERVLFPGGDAEELPDVGSFSSEEIDNLVEVLGIPLADSEMPLSRVIVKASDLRVRLGGVLQTLTGDGCDDIAEGVRGLEEIAKAYSERSDKGDSLTDFLSDVPNQNDLSRLFDGLGVDTDAVGSTPESLVLASTVVNSVRNTLDGVSRRSGGPEVRVLSAESVRETVELVIRTIGHFGEELGTIREELIACARRDPTTDLGTLELLRLTLEEYGRECERRQDTHDRVQKILLRVAGECGEGLSTETMLDRIEQALGPEPEF